MCFSSIKRSITFPVRMFVDSIRPGTACSAENKHWVNSLPSHNVCYAFPHFSRGHFTVASIWGRWRLKSPASPLFTQPFIKAHIKENIKAPRHWPHSLVTGEFPAQRASNAENVSIWCRHHAYYVWWAPAVVPPQTDVSGRAQCLLWNGIPAPNGRSQS